MNIKIYIVFGESGECSDTERWMVKAFKDETKAKLLCDLAQQQANILKLKADREEIGHWEAEGLNQYDKNYRMVYHEVNYDIQEIELEC
jgi:hypothetical protein